MMPGETPPRACPLLARRIRPAYLLSGGLGIAVAGLLIMTLTNPPPAGGAVLIVGFVLASLGGGPLVTLGTNMVVSSAPPEKAGSASAVAQTGNEFGHAFGVAVIGSIVIAAYRTRIVAVFPAAGPAARDTLVGAAQAARNLHPQAAGLLLAAARPGLAAGPPVPVTLTCHARWDGSADPAVQSLGKGRRSWERSSVLLSSASTA